MNNKNINRILVSLLISSLGFFFIRKYFEIDNYFTLVKTLEIFCLSLVLIVLVVFCIVRLMQNSEIKNIWMPLIGILGMFILFFLSVKSVTSMFLFLIRYWYVLMKLFKEEFMSKCVGITTATFSFFIALSNRKLFK